MLTRPKTDVPPWLTTFADLVTLLLCFFVLITSFSQRDGEHVRQLIVSMRDAFGVTYQPRDAGQALPPGQGGEPSILDGQPMIVTNEPAQPGDGRTPERLESAAA